MVSSIMSLRFKSDSDRVQRDVNALAAFGRVGPTAITRLAYTPADNAAYAYI